MEEPEFAQQFSDIEQLVLRVGWLEQRRFAQDLASFGLTPPQFHVLRDILVRGGDTTMSALAEDTLQHCATMTGVVDRLVKMALVIRHRAAHDRRQVLVQLTPTGRQVLELVRHSREERLRKTLSRLSPPDAENLLHLLKAYLKAFRVENERAEDTYHTSLEGVLVESQP